MAAATTANYKIDHNLKNIYMLDTQFFSRPMFSRTRNAMKLSIAFYDHRNYLKIQMAAIWVKIGVLRLNIYLRGVIYVL